jgi:hypothetical protein
VAGADKEWRTYEPSGFLARVDVTETPTTDAGGIPCVKREFGKVSIDKPFRADDYYIVSSLVLEAVRIHGHLFADRMIAPDTGKTAVRSADGKVVAVTRFVRL